MELIKPNRSIWSWKCLLCVPFMVLSLFSALAAQPGVLRDIQVAKNSSGVEVRIILTAGISHKVLELPSPARLVLDLPGIEKIAARSEIEVGGGGILRIRTGLFTRDTARIVFDTAGKIPRYEIVKTVEGLKVIFRAEPGAPPAQEEQAKIPPPKAETAKPIVQDKPPALAAGQEQARAAEKTEDAEKRRQEKALRASEQTLKRAEASVREALSEPIRSYRAAAFLGPYFPKASALKDRYGIGVKLGAEISARIDEKVEVWLSASTRGQSSADSAAGGDRSFRLFPLLVGLNYRPIEGFVNPYLGFGAGYFFFSETFAGATSREIEFGLQGRAGVFLKLSRVFILGLHAQFDHCRMVSNSARIDPGGFHIGLFAGGEF